VSPFHSRRDRAPDPSLIASDGDLRRSQRRSAAVRAGVWLSLAAGPLALAAAFVAPQMAQSAPVTQASAPALIAPPLGYAESFVDLWLRGSADGSTPDALRAMAPTVDLPRPAGLARVSVQKVVAVRSVPMGGRTWQVTVAATIVLPPVAAQSDGAAQSPAQGSVAQSPSGAQNRSAQPGSGAQSGELTVRFFAVPVQMIRATGSAGAPDALAVTAAPAQVAAPAVLSGWDPAVRAYPAQINDGAIRQSVTDYLTAYLTGVGDPGRYLSPGTRLPAPGAVYAKVSLSTLAATGPVPAAPADGTVLEVQAEVRAMDRVGEWPLTYPMRLQARAGRWEIAALAPASSATSSSPSPSPYFSGASASPQPASSSSSSNGVR